MSINLVTYANQTVTPTNDAIIYEKAIDQNGIFYGCNVTVTSNTVNITGGYGIVCGREFVINSESISVTLAPSGTLQGRLYVRLDLADADAPIQLLTATGNTLPALVQDDDVNYTNGVYEMELATFTVGVSALSDVVETFDIIEGLKTIIDTITTKTSAAITPLVGTSYSAYGGCYYEVLGGHVHVHIGLSGLTANSNLTVAKLPAEIFPSTTIVMVGRGASTNTLCYASIGANGDVLMNSTGAYAMVDFTYFAH